MTPDDALAFGRTFSEFIDEVRRLAPAGPSSLITRLTEHLGTPPNELPVVASPFPLYQHANLQAALDAYLARPGRSYDLVGAAGPGRDHFSFTDVLAASGNRGMFEIGTADYTSVPVGIDAEKACVSFGIYLVSDGDHRYVVCMRLTEGRGQPGCGLDVLAPSTDLARAFLAEIQDLVREHNLFRGQVISFEKHEFGPGVGPLKFHRRPHIDAADVILPPGTLDLVHRQVLGVADHRDRLLAAGHHLKRGVLLFGPPGTGKTHTVRHLMGRLPDATIVVLTGLGLGAVREACAMARQLTPALVVLEDVDLVAEERMPGGQQNPLLFQVLNEMDGIAGDADVTFLLTTNRVDLIEPALAQRPGRVDLAVEVPHPDDDGRRRLLDLYGRNLKLTGAEADEIVAATAGATASLFSELARRAELLAATSGEASAGAAQARAALAELTASQSALSQAKPAPGRPPAPRAFG
ncbi:AAA family ATPase [Virgisporangium ochraceum]|uniref:ATPase n=1 Tax=Virgisporangium ochraceum TaxID=65505 RepID=A0A8J4A3K5_9ACTN|nr:ATP-binding protein [Virgisporangium ochraceum]GIJ75224.1 ATPase [Virgisporangium ochraceum]